MTANIEYTPEEVRFILACDKSTFEKLVKKKVLTYNQERPFATRMFSEVQVLKLIVNEVQ